MSAYLLGYIVLFAAAFGAASLLPFYSEPVLVGMLLTEIYHPFGLWLVASTGNTLGALLNWFLGRSITYWRSRPWFPVDPGQLERASRWFRKYGTWTLLLTWSPVGGDALTFIAGIMRVPVLLFLLLVGIGKSARYATIIWLTGATSG